MKVKFLSHEAVSYIKKNRTSVFEALKNESFVDHLNNRLSLTWYTDSNFYRPTINFYIDRNISPIKTDIKNSKIIHSYFKNLTESQASEERFWAGLAIEQKNYEYLNYRWGNDDKTIRYRVVYHAAGKRGFMYHGLARLWWFAHITYDESHNNPYKYTEFCFEYPHILEKMLYRNYSNSKEIRTGIIKGIYQYINEGGVYRIRYLDKLYNHISALSGAHMLDVFTEEDIKQITIKELNKYLLEDKK